MSATFHGHVALPGDNGARDDASAISFDRTTSPLSTAAAGDFVHVTISQRDPSVTFSIANAGGQTWTTKTAMTSGSQKTQVFTCQFNGTWSADPSFDTNTRTGARFSGLLQIFRPSGTPTWASDVAQANSNASPTTPFDVTVPAQTATAAGVSVAVWASTDFDGTPMTLQTGVSSGWANPGGVEQFRNQVGASSDITIASAYKLNSGSGSTGSVTKRLDATVTTLYLMETFKDQSVATSARLLVDPLGLNARGLAA